MAFSGKYLKIDNEQYPLFTSLDDVLDSSNHYMTAEKDNEIYYLRLINADNHGEVKNINVTDLGNINFPNTKPIIPVISGYLNLEKDNISYRSSKTLLSTKGCECDCINCSDVIMDYSSENSKHIVYKYADCSKEENDEFGGLKEFINGSDCKKYYNNCYKYWKYYNDSFKYEC